MMVCHMGAFLYEPINVYKPVAANIGIVDGPFEYLTVGGAKLPLPFTTRMTVVRLSNGDLFLHSPIKFDGRLANGLLGLGAVHHLVSPNQFHYAHIGEWAKAFPKVFLTLRIVARIKMKRGFIYTYGVALLSKMDLGGERERPIFAIAILGKENRTVWRRRQGWHGIRPLSPLRQSRDLRLSCGAKDRGPAPQVPKCLLAGWRLIRPSKIEPGRRDLATR